MLWGGFSAPGGTLFSKQLEKYITSASCVPVTLVPIPYINKQIYVYMCVYSPSPIPSRWSSFSVRASQIWSRPSAFDFAFGTGHCTEASGIRLGAQWLAGRHRQKVRASKTCSVPADLSNASHFQVSIGLLGDPPPILPSLLPSPSFVGLKPYKHACMRTYTHMGSSLVILVR